MDVLANLEAKLEKTEAVTKQETIVSSFVKTGTKSEQIARTQKAGGLLSKSLGLNILKAQVKKSKAAEQFENERL